MQSSIFTINERFLINPALGTVVDHQTSQENRLEPRLMQLLELLAANAGQLVSRERITREIWDDYGNADEGLTQAISYLRKVLDDGTKSLIETIPKKGYVLRASIIKGNTGPESVEIISRQHFALSPGRIVMIAFIITIIFTAGYMVYNSSKPANPQHRNPDIFQSANENIPAGDSVEKRKSEDVIDTGAVK